MATWGPPQGICTSGACCRRTGVAMSGAPHSRRPLRRAGDRRRRRRTQARIAGTTAYVLARLGDVDAGERLCLDILARGGLSPATVAQLQGQLGALALERGLLDDAAEWLTKSIRGLADAPVRQANMRLNRTLVDMQRGRLDVVMADLELAETAYRDAGLTDEVNLAIHNRGYTMMLAGDLVTALKTMQSVREPLDGESEVWAAINELDRAEVLREAGLVTEAESSLQSVSQAFGRHRAPRERATADYHLARSLLSHDPERAALVAAAAARRFSSVGSPGWAVRAEAILLRARLAVGRIDRTGTPVRVPRRLPSPVGRRGRRPPARPRLRAGSGGAPAHRGARSHPPQPGRRDARGADRQPDAARAGAARA